jgi:hypothetical protein
LINQIPIGGRWQGPSATLPIAVAILHCVIESISSFVCPILTLFADG